MKKRSNDQKSQIVSKDVTDLQLQKKIKKAFAFFDEIGRKYPSLKTAEQLVREDRDRDNS